MKNQSSLILYFIKMENVLIAGGRHLFLAGLIFFGGGGGGLSYNNIVLDFKCLDIKKEGWASLWRAGARGIITI